MCGLDFIGFFTTDVLDEGSVTSYINLCVPWVKQQYEFKFCLLHVLLTEGVCLVQVGDTPEIQKTHCNYNSSVSKPH